jgi:colanic acid/amylovoran biosynthesis protein
MDSESKGSKVFCILGAGYETGNRGVAALASGTINVITTAFPDAKVFLLDYSRKGTTYEVGCANGYVQVDLVNIRFSKKFLLPNNIAYLLLLAVALKLIPSKFIRDRAIARNKVLSRIDGADTIGSIAGGDSFSDIYGLGRFIYIVLPQILVLLLGKKLTLLPQTLGPFRGAVAKATARYIIGNSEKVYARDRVCVDELETALGRKFDKIEFSYDMAFAVLAEAPKSPVVEWIGSGKGPLVGINPSGLLYFGGYTRNNMFGLKAGYPNLLRQLVAKFLEDPTARVILIPHAFKSEDKVESDTIVCDELFDEFVAKYPNRIYNLSGDLNEREIKFCIGKCTFFIGSRMHACIGGLSQCVPSIGLAYSEKFRGVFESIGVPDLLVDLRLCSPKEALFQVESAFARRDHLQTRLRLTIPHVRNSVLNLFCGPSTGPLPGVRDKLSDSAREGAVSSLL